MNTTRSYGDPDSWERHKALYPRIEHPTLDDTLLRGGRVRIVSEDQAANLREQQCITEESRTGGSFTVCSWQAHSDLEDLDEEMDRVGEESQDDGSWEPA